MPIPKQKELFSVILKFLSDSQEHKMNDICDYCAEYFSLSDDDKKIMTSSGQSMFVNRVYWARLSLKNAGLIEAPQRATICITSLGLEELAKEDIKITSDVAEDTHAEEAQSPQERIDYAIEQLKAALADDLLTEVINMNEYDFEHLVVDLLLKMGYGKPEENKNAVTRKSGDSGIDGIVRADKFGFDAVYTQAKKWKSDSHIQSPEIQKFLGAMVAQGATKGLFITTGQFSKGALDFSQKNPGQKIVLVDGRQLAELMIEYNLGVTTTKTYEIKRIDSDYFNKDA